MVAKPKYSQATLKKGTRVERKEHGFNWVVSQKIARDHLKESPRYYSELAKMERRMHRKK